MSGLPANYDAWRLASPPEDPILSGAIARYLIDGIYADQEVEIEYDTRNGLTIYTAMLVETGEEIDPAEITEKDRDAFITSIWENYENEK